MPTFFLNNINLIGHTWVSVSTVSSFIDSVRVVVGRDEVVAGCNFRRSLEFHESGSAKWRPHRERRQVLRRQRPQERQRRVGQLKRLEQARNPSFVIISKIAQAGGELVIFWFSLTFSHKQRLKPLVYCAPYLFYTLGGKISNRCP